MLSQDDYKRQAIELFNILTSHLIETDAYEFKARTSRCYKEEAPKKTIDDQREAIKVVRSRLVVARKMVDNLIDFLEVYYATFTEEDRRKGIPMLKTAISANSLVEKEEK